MKDVFSDLRTRRILFIVLLLGIAEKVGLNVDSVYLYVYERN